jgi:uncharacterized membrane protein
MSSAKSDDPPDQKQLEKLIKGIDPQAFELIPQKARPRVARLVQIAVTQTTASRFSSPLPPPDALARYNEIVPGAAERIFKMAEEQSAHRKQIETKLIGAQIRQSDCGQWLALAVAVLFLCGCIWLTFGGHDWVGGMLGGTTVVGLVTAFITSKSQQKTDLAEKRPGSQKRKH